MGDNQLTLDPATLFDNPSDHQVELTGSLDGETYRLAVRYAVLEALGATPPIERPAAIVEANSDVIACAALAAIGRADAQDPVIVTERDLDAATTRSDGDDRAEAQAHPS